MLDYQGHEISQGVKCRKKGRNSWRFPE